MRDTDRVIHTGDTVRLWSDGPLMTAEALGRGGTVSCIWWDDNNNGYRRIVLLGDSLEIVPR